MTRDYKVWFPDDDETVDDAQDVLHCRSAEEAAEQAVEGFRSGPDYEDLIDGEPVRVVVLDEEDGDLRTFSVHVRAEITYSADEVVEAVDG